MIRRVGLFLLLGLEVILLSLFVLIPRAANYQDVFVAGNVYFTDADCYARMTRVRLCAGHPGLVLRHHDFENFPIGTTPHTTAPFDYLVLGLSVALRPFTVRAIDVAGALVSPFLALMGGWFLWGWARRMQFRYRWILLLLYAMSPILVHGAELGRPDHQSLVLLLLIIGICAEWTLSVESSTIWSVVSGAAWGFAIWVSAYEPVLLLLLVIGSGVLSRRFANPRIQSRSPFVRDRRAGWIVFAFFIAVSLLVERRFPSFSVLQAGPVFSNWSRTIGELQSVPPWHEIWFQWTGYMIVSAPILIWFSWSDRVRRTEGSNNPPFFLLALMVAAFGLTIWQARWGYFFALFFALALPVLLASIRSRTAVWIAFALSLFPILRAWDAKLWPNEIEAMRLIENRSEAVQLHDLAVNLESSEVHPFLAPWWLSPAIAYWSGQPGVAGSSHESLDGIVDSARFFLATDPEKARQVLQKRNVAWVVADDADRVASNSAAILATAIPEHPICQILERTPAQAPSFLAMAAQTGVSKLFRVALDANNR